MKPLIGISVNTEQRQLGDEKLFYTYLNEAYAQAVVQAGGIPLLIPSVTPLLAGDYAHMIDGLILAGGEDIHPDYYQAAQAVETKPAFAHKDASDFALIQAMVEHQKPIFGICRGFQALNVAFGGTLIQDVSYLSHSEDSHVDLNDFLVGQHEMTLAKASKLERVLGSTVKVNSLHHQTIGKLGTDFTVVAKSEDGLIEAIEHQKLPIFAVQWHPELLALADETQTNPLFIHFVQEVCRT